MGKHSSQSTSYWETFGRRHDLRRRTKAREKGLDRKSPIGYYKFFIVILVAFVVGGALGFYAKPIAKLAAKYYLAVKIKKSHVTGTEAKEVQKVITTVSPDPNQSVNTLIIGSDSGSNKGEGGWCRSDVMLLVCMQERDKKAVVLSIPRDTKVELPGHGTQKINAAHSFGGPSGAIQAVTTLTGLPVHHFIDMNFQGFMQIVNALGGIPIHLNAPINDPHAGYLPAGDLKLDGWQALVVVRSRNMPNGDIDRIKDQQAFLKALLDKANQMKSVWKANQLVDIVTSTCKMDYSADQLMNLAQEVQGFTPQSVQFVTVPGDSPTIGGVSYFVQNAPLLAQITTEIQQNNWLSPDLEAKLQSNNSRAAVLNAPNADVITVLGTSKNTTPAVPVVTEELRLMGHQQVTPGMTNVPVPRTTVYFRAEAKDNGAGMLKSVPELAGANVVQNDQLAVQYNSPIVVVLGPEFVTPGLTSIYGRIAAPALNVELGAKQSTFN